MKSLLQNEYSPSQRRLYSDVLGHVSIVQRIQLEKKLKVHNGCVNTITWNHSGEYILSGSDDLKLVITNPFNGRVAVKLPSGHRRNIFQARFMPDSGNRRIVSCAAGGTLAYTEINRPHQHGGNMFSCHKQTVYQVKTTPGDPHTFLSCSEDGTVRNYDLREEQSCNTQDCRKNVILDLKAGVTCMDIDPVRSCYLAIATCNQPVVRVFDRRMISDNSLAADNYTVRSYRLPATKDSARVQATCLQYDRLGERLLVSTTPRHVLELDAWVCDRIDKLGEDYQSMETPPVTENKDEGTCDDTPPPRANRDNMVVRLTGDWSDTGPSAVSNTAPNDAVGVNLTRTDRMFRQMSAALTSVLRVRNESHDRDEDITEESNEDISNNDDLPQRNPFDATNQRSAPGASAAHLSSQSHETSANQSSQPDAASANQSLDAAEADHTEDVYSNIDTAHNIIPYMAKTGVYSGHRNKRTAIKQVSYWGDDLIVSGSDCGHIFIWRRDSGKLLNVIEADRRVVNCVQPHPEYPVLASSGIDYDIKLWTPKHADDDYINEKLAYISQVVEKNETMLRDHADVVTVPARFIAPLLALLARRARTDDEPTQFEEG